MHPILKNSKVKRRSAKRDAILRLLQSGALDHPTADEVYRRMRRYYPSISLGTVYRNLNEMSEGGVIAKISSPAEPDHFDQTLIPHLHFKCSRCKKVFDVNSSRPLSGTSASLQNKGFVIENISISISGLCPTCASKK